MLIDKTKKKDLKESPTLSKIRLRVGLKKDGIATQQLVPALRLL